MPAHTNATNCPNGTLTDIDGVICRDNVSVTFDGTDIPWQPITLADIASFRPAPVALQSQPSGWAVRGLPANFVAPAGRQVVAGTLLGALAEVRFTPITWRWTYGDGAIATTSSGGATWADRGAPRFTPTPTSHIYRSRGTVSVSVSVEYRAEYRFSGSVWGTVVGTLVLESPPQPMLVVAESTVLVDGHCGSNAAAPGC